MERKKKIDVTNHFLIRSNQFEIFSAGIIIIPNLQINYLIYTAYIIDVYIIIIYHCN